jgi:hypothetical protein
MKTPSRDPAGQGAADSVHHDGAVAARDAIRRTLCVADRSRGRHGFADPGRRDTLANTLGVQFINPKGRYLPNQDEPRLLDNRGPACYDVTGVPDQVPGYGAQITPASYAGSKMQAPRP